MDKIVRHSVIELLIDGKRIPLFAGGPPPNLHKDPWQSLLRTSGL